MTDPNIPVSAQPRVVVVGCGFGGLRLAQKLADAPVQVVLLDRNNYHTFQPLLYQVATGALEAESIAHPVREIFAKQRNSTYRLCEVQHLDHQRKALKTSIGEISYDYLVLASGSTTNFFGNASAAKNSMQNKSVPDALALRNLLFRNLEQAVLETDPARRQALLTIVVVGGGPTGVELSGTLGEMRQRVLPRAYPELRVSDLKIILVEAGPVLLGHMSKKSQADAGQYMAGFGVEVRLNTSIKKLEDDKAYYSDTDFIPTANLIWAAGVQGVVVPGLPADAVGHHRLNVNAYNQVQGFDNVFAIGDVASLVDKDHPKGYPMLAPVAQQQAEQLAHNLQRLLKHEQPVAFSYFDKGTMAIMGRNKAVADLPKGIHFSGFLGWLTWLFVHVLTLIGFRNKAIALIDWTFSYFGSGQALRLVLRAVPGSDSVEAATTKPK